MPNHPRQSHPGAIGSDDRPSTTPPSPPYSFLVPYADRESVCMAGDLCIHPLRVQVWLRMTDTDVETSAGRV